MRINDVFRTRAGTVKDGPDAACEIEVGRDYADRGSRGAGVTMPCKRCLDGTST